MKQQVSQKLFNYDSSLRNTENINIICGVDEAGRGALAGDVYAGAVILHEGAFIEGLNDSKKIIEKKRELLFDEIIGKSVSYGIGIATVEEIELINILEASLLAMKRAIEQAVQNYTSSSMAAAVTILIDGNKIPNDMDRYLDVRCLVSGDGTSASIAAASILAKVSRDRYMREQSSVYGQYLFEKHKGYGTKEHTDLILRYGVSPIHRRSFLRKLLAYDK